MQKRVFNLKVGQSNQYTSLFDDHSQWDYKGHRCWIKTETDPDDGTVKAFHNVRTTDGQELRADISPYDTNPQTVNLWIDAGYPARQNGLPWDLNLLEMRVGQLKSSSRVFVLKTSGYQVVDPLDPAQYPNREKQGLEGPYKTKSGKVVYYDPKGQVDKSQAPGLYYDPSTDMYLTHEEYEALNQPRSPISYAKTNVFDLKKAQRYNSRDMQNEWENKSPEDLQGKYAIINKTADGVMYVEEVYDDPEDAQRNATLLAQKYPPDKYHQNTYEVAHIDNNFPYEPLMAYIEMKMEDERDSIEEARAFDHESDSVFGDDQIDGVGFSDPGGNSALRAETDDNPRNLPCPNCGRPNMLTPIDAQKGYQCDSCANAAEGGFEGYAKTSIFNLKTSQHSVAESGDFSQMVKAFLDMGEPELAEKCSMDMSNAMLQAFERAASGSESAIEFLKRRYVR